MASDRPSGKVKLTKVTLNRKGKTMVMVKLMILGLRSD